MSPNCLAGGARDSLFGPEEIGDSIVFGPIPKVLINGVVCTFYNVGQSEHLQILTTYIEFDDVRGSDRKSVCQ